MPRAFAALLSAAAMLVVPSPAADAQPPVAGPPVVLDGPSTAISRPSGLGVSIARDGTGGLVYLKAVSGTAHVFVSRLVAGAFQTPVQVDSQLPGASSQPVIAAGNGGILLIGFINGGQLYVVQANPSGQLTAPRGLASGAINPAISMTNFGKAYIAFAVADGSGHDVRTAYYNGSWALEPQPLNNTPADDAGATTATRPAVAAAGDGIGIVTWGENGNIFTRRVWGTQPSVVDEQADATAPGGCVEQSADSPVVGAGGDSSYAAVAFHAVLNCAGQSDSRVLINRLQGSVYDGISEADGLNPSATDGAAHPQIAVAENGGGWVTSDRTGTGDLFAASLGPNASFAGTIAAVNSLPESTVPRVPPVPAIAGYHADLIAWQQLPGGSPGGEIRVRFAGDGVTLGPETVLSSPTGGPTDAQDGLAADGDISGDAAIAWLQGSPGATELVVGQLYQPPGSFSATRPFFYTSKPQPVLAWARPKGWGPLTYSVTIDGTQLGQTSGTSLQPPPLADGPHAWQVTATNPAGQQSTTPTATVFVDTVAPIGVLKLHARTPAGSTLHVVARYFDHPPAGEPGVDASGVAKVVIRWGDGHSVHLRIGTHRISHVYEKPGRYRVVLTVTDQAGNVSRDVKYVKVVRPRHRHAAGTKAHH